MLHEKVIDRALKNCIGTDRSRCLRMRFNRNTCSLCMQQCSSGAIGIGEDVTINMDNCSECMLCVSACPSGCFEIRGLDFYSIIARLRKIGASVQSPVIGCSKTASPPSHLRTFCFGYLSEELLIALSVYIQNSVQLDLTGCAGCNASVAGILETRLENIEAMTGIRISEKIRLVKDKGGLDFQDISYDRRSFFRAIKDMTLMQASGLFGDDGDTQGTQSYSAKKMPFKKEVLNRTIKLLPPERRSAVLYNYYYKADVSGDCNNCFACIGICPTGSLKTVEAEGSRELSFNSSLCTGCSLCSSICRRGLIIIEKGFSGDNPFGFQHTKKEHFLMSVA